MNNYINKKILNFDYIIFGSGAVGSTLANDLSANNSVALVDIGQIYNKDISFRKTPPFVNKCSDIYSPSYSGVFGGNTALWNSKIYLISEKECKSWPIKYKELVYFSKNCADQFGIEHDDIHKINIINKYSYLHRSRRWKKQNINNFDALVNSSKMNLFHYLNIQENKNITCFQKSSIYDFNFSKNKNKNKIKTITIFNGKEFIKIKIKNSVILCCGGLGNIPIYYKFMSKMFGKNYIEKKLNLSDHPHYEIGKVKLKKKNFLMKSYINLIKNKKGIEDCHLIFGKKNTYAFQFDGYKIFTSPFLRLYKKSKNHYLQKLYLFLNRIFGKFHKIMKILICGKNFRSIYSLALFFEEPKKSKSFISLSKNKWFYNFFPKLDIFYENPNIDKRQLLIELSESTKFKIKNFYNYYFAKSNVLVGLHPSCSTPVKLHPRKTELNTNLGIRGTDNLYMCGSNIFPTNGVTNPTWTLITLSRRLSVHLKERYAIH